jgi:[protein-PII] uridylyltransferase
VSFENHDPACTIVKVEALDRLGLLQDILEALSQSELNVVQALIDTDDEIARDLFYVTDIRGGKVVEQARLELIRTRVLQEVNC